MSCATVIRSPRGKLPTRKLRRLTLARSMTASASGTVMPGTLKYENAPDSVLQRQLQIFDQVLAYGAGKPNPSWNEGKTNSSHRL